MNGFTFKDSNSGIIMFLLPFRMDLLLQEQIFLLRVHPILEALLHSGKQTGSHKSYSLSETAGVAIPLIRENLTSVYVYAQTSVVSCFLPRLSTKERLLAETVHMILLPAVSLSKKQNHSDSLCRKLFTTNTSLGRKQEIGDSLGGRQV